MTTRPTDTEPPGAGTGRPQEAALPRHGLSGGVESFVARIPFRAKLAVVWLLIGIAMLLAFLQADFNTEWMRDRARLIVEGVWVTIFFAVCAIILGIILALLGALGRLSKNAIAYGLAGFYTSFFRGTPLIVQLYLWMFALPQLGAAFREPYSDWFILSPQVAGILGLGLNYGAYMTEIFRAGIQSVPHGQSEAAEALGMSYRQRMRRVVLPQAFRVIIPPTGNEFIAMMKDTALVGLLGTTIFWADPFRKATLLGRADFRNLEALVIAALVYWILTGIFSFFQRKLERRVSKGYVREAVEPRRTRVVTGTPGQGGGMRGGASGYEVPEADVPEQEGQGH